MRSCCFLACVGLLALWLPGQAMGQLQRSENLPTTAPAALPSASVAELRHWVAGLGDEDAAVRQAARSALLNLNRDDLPVLKQAAAAEAPLLPQQILTLHEIAINAYLASEESTSDGSGFLGLHWPQDYAMTYPVHDLGLVVVERVPGFCAYRVLQQGDVIVRLLDYPEVDVRNRDLFINAVSKMRAGQKLRMAVLRQGSVVHVDIVLDPRPVALTQARLQQQPADVFPNWERDRTAKAEEYWSEQFNSIIPQEMQNPEPATTQP